jgi:gamma-glutamyltranspeptidase
VRLCGMRAETEGEDEREGLVQAVDRSSRTGSSSSSPSHGREKEKKHQQGAPKAGGGYGGVAEGAMFAILIVLLLVAVGVTLRSAYTVDESEEVGTSLGLQQVGTSDSDASDVVMRELRAILVSDVVDGFVVLRQQKAAAALTKIIVALSAAGRRGWVDTPVAYDWFLVSSCHSSGTASPPVMLNLTARHGALRARPTADAGAAGLATLVAYDEDLPLWGATSVQGFAILIRGRGRGGNGGSSSACAALQQPAASESLTELEERVAAAAAAATPAPGGINSTGGSTGAAAPSPSPSAPPPATAATDNASAPWFDLASRNTVTGDGRPIRDLPGGARGAACRSPPPSPQRGQGARGQGGRGGLAVTGGAVASTNYLATQAGLAVLADGGNAADAAVAVQLMLAVAQPESNGLGGGCFILHYDASARQVTTIDGREEAPARFHPHVFCANASCAADPHCGRCSTGPLPFAERHTGGLPVGVPGTLAATAKLWQTHGSGSSSSSSYRRGGGGGGGGRWSLARLAAPAVSRAREGINMTAHLYRAIASNIDRLRLWNASASLFLSADRRRPVAEIGHDWFNPDLAQTLEQLTGQPGRVRDFYESDLAVDIVRAVQRAAAPHFQPSGTDGHGSGGGARAGMLERSDLAGYRAVLRAPTRVSFRSRAGPGGSGARDYEIYGMAPPSSGGATMGMIFNLLEEALRAGDFSPLPPAAAAHNNTSGGPSGGSGSGTMADTATSSSAGAGGAAGSRVQMDASLAAATNAFGATGSFDGAGRGYPPRTLAALIDAQNIAFADRNKYLGDPDFVELPLPPFVPDDGRSGLLSKVYAKQRWRRWRGRTARGDVPWGVPPGWNGTLGAGALEDDHGTTHFVVVDRWQNVVSWTTTIESNLGSSVVVPGRGILLNNELTDFDADAHDAQVRVIYRLSEFIHQR